MPVLPVAASMPFSHVFHLGSLDFLPVPIQSFGIIVAVGVVIGAALLRRYAEWHGVSDEHIRGITGWIMIPGFIGAHLFDVIAYQWQDVQNDPLLIIELWKGISSYGGFIGGGLGWAFYVWWKRLPPRLMSDIAIVGLLPAFSIGRIGCTVVSDHIGAAVAPDKWYSFLAINYPTSEGFGPIEKLAHAHPEIVHNGAVLAWNLGLIEFLYLVPVNALVLWLAFRPKKRINAGLVPVLTGMLYAPVRFFLDFLRPDDTDPRYLYLTFAQWASFLCFGAAAYLAFKVWKSGEPAEIVAPTSGEAQRKLKSLLKEQDDAEAAKKKSG